MSRPTLEHLLVVAGTIGVVAFFVWAGRNSVPSVAIESIDPAYQVTRDTFATMGDMFPLQGECLDDILNRQQTDTPACLALARLKAELAADAASQGDATGRPWNEFGLMTVMEGTP